MANNESPNSTEDSPEVSADDNKEVSKLTSAAPREKSSLVEIMQIVIPAISAIAVAYFSYLQITQPKMLEIAATQTAVVVSQAVVPAATSAELPTDLPSAPAIAASALTETVAAAPTAPPATESPTPEDPTAEAAPTATTLASNAAASPTTVPPAVPTEVPTDAPTAVPTTGAATAPTSVPAAAPTSVASIAPIGGDMALLTTADGEQPTALLPESLKFQGTPGLELLSGEWIPFTNLFSIEVGQVRGGVIPVELTFTDGLTQSATVEQGADTIIGETARGTVQVRLAEIERLEFPNPAQEPLPDLPLVAILSQEGDTAHVIASTLRFQGAEGFDLRNGEHIPFANIVTVDVGQVRAGEVPIELTFTDGLTQSATVEQGADFLNGETLHGTFERNTYKVQQLQLPNAAQPAAAMPAANELVTLTTPEGNSAQVIASTLRFQGVEGFDLRNGENIPFTNIVTVDVRQVRAGEVPIELTFTDGLTQSAMVEQGADFLNGETLHGTFERNTHKIQQIQLPNELQPAAQPLATANELVTLTTPEGNTAHVIASTLRFQDVPALSISSGESIPFDVIRTIVVGAVRGGEVAIEITFTDGATQSATVPKGADHFKGETLHGDYIRRMNELKQVDFP